MSKLIVGDVAPEINGVDQNGQAISLASLKGHKVVLYFYPKDNTPGCTAQACNLRDNTSLLQQAGMKVVGVSTDDVKSHKKFEEKYTLPFPLIADVDHKVVEDYGVWGLKKFMGKEYMGTNRTTFLIDENGVIAHIISKVQTKDHTQQILDLWT